MKTFSIICGIVAIALIAASIVALFQGCTDSFFAFGMVCGLSMSALFMYVERKRTGTVKWAQK